MISLPLFKVICLEKLEDKIQSSVQCAVNNLVKKNTEEIGKLDSQVNMLQKQVQELKRQNNILSEKCDNINEDALRKIEDVEQYGRRLCLQN